MSTLHLSNDMPRTLVTKPQKRPTRRLEFLAYAAIAFPIFLVICTLMRLVMLPVRLVRGGPHKPSVFAEASEMTNSVIPWVFMGR